MLTVHAIHLLHEAAFGTLATQSSVLAGYPYATVVPYVTDHAHQPVICISALAEHTKNLLADTRMSLSVLQPEVTDVQAASRLTIVGDAERFEPATALRDRYLRYEPGAERLLALDFAFFRLKPLKVRFIVGVGRMGWVEQADLDAVPTLPAQEEADLVSKMSRLVPQSVRVLGIDPLGVDVEINGRRHRHRLAGTAPIDEAIQAATHAITAITAARQ
ncbi:pyridoxamine 5'-phosphate oxidase [Cupriavidus sp. HMR-1]|uniref:HugZ family pyridoxamine 5'-phosphate oxidase n=1 Tax=Cupriavidus sp. HMR-1 TaxID=1249621 RepID=UPI0002A1A951|nr:pyridoxamine 5'-phosphate oxidase family protein [Cupriavidus sp. HMR-1]EKZ98357.1 pyridoxamine 5'-phosphate oxidase [Cupriavidus sp. HMR-1]